MSRGISKLENRTIVIIEPEVHKEKKKKLKESEECNGPVIYHQADQHTDSEVPEGVERDRRTERILKK